jgi:peptidoglycan/LPS O-acetylase OafA/YrhL
MSDVYRISVNVKRVPFPDGLWFGAISFCRMTSRTRHHMKQWANLDFLRSIAVMLVVFQHTLLYTGRAYLVGWTGLTGVSFFFVHTCLVLMWSLERDPHVGRFYVRRIFRIYPLWIAVLVFVVLLRIPTSPLFAPHFGFYMPLPREWVPELLLLFNLRFGAHVVGASWTLPIEVQMYLMLPYLFFFMRSVRKLWPLLILDAFMILWGFYQYPPNVANLPICIPYFMGGAIAYQLTKQVRPKIPGWIFPIFIALLVTVAYRYGNYRNSWFVCLILGLSLPHFHQMRWKPLLAFSHYLARYSYGIYLCHFVAIAVGFYYLQGHTLLVKAIGFFATLIVLPLLFYHLLEEPMIRLGAKIAKRIEPGPPILVVTDQTLNMEPAP